MIGWSELGWVTTFVLLLAMGTLQRKESKVRKWRYEAALRKMKEQGKWDGADFRRLLLNAPYREQQRIATRAVDAITKRERCIKAGHEPKLRQQAMTIAKLHSDIGTLRRAYAAVIHGEVTVDTQAVDKMVIPVKRGTDD